MGVAFYDHAPVGSRSTIMLISAVTFILVKMKEDFYVYDLNWPGILIFLYGLQ